MVCDVLLDAPTSTSSTTISMMAVAGPSRRVSALNTLATACHSRHIASYRVGSIGDEQLA